MTLHIERRGRNNDELQEAIDTLDIEAWMDQEGVKYRSTRGSSGRQLNVKECPCCGNSHYKVYINADTGLGNCFAGDCGENFNKWKFIKNHLGGDNRAAVTHILKQAREQGWRPPKLQSNATSNTGRLILPASFPLPFGGRNLKYLDNRGITAAIAKYFALRFSQRGAFSYKSESGQSLVQDYSNRIIIPVYDLDGDLVSFQGRDITGKAEKKYLFPPGFSSTGTHLYNGHNAIGAEKVCVGEGVFDVAAIKIALDADLTLRDVVPIGTFGKHLSSGDEDSQLAKLMRLKADGLREITFMWDGEDKAIEDAIEAALLCHSVGFTARLAILPKDKDPNEVPPQTVRDAYWRARVVTPTTAMTMRLLHGRAIA